jgi:carbamoyltransferase
MNILGISAFYHDSSAALIQNGEIIFACQEERLTRIKHDASFPEEAIKSCLQFSGLKTTDIDAIIFYEKPFLKFERLLETALAFAPKGFNLFRKFMPIWLNEKLFQKKLLADELQRLGFLSAQTERILFSEHHLSHASSAFYCSPFDEALVLTMDGVGEWDTTTVYKGQGSQLEKLYELHFPHSLGLLYSAFTYHCGFKVNSGEYKLMGLAPYGKDIYANVIKENLIDIKDDGSFKLDLSYFEYCTGLTMTNKKFDALFQNSRREPEEELKQIHMDLAASIQSVLEEVVLKMCCFLKKKYSLKNICLAGGVALNCAANGKLKQTQLFEKIWIQPAAGDAGGSIGAALAAYYMQFKQPRKINPSDSMKGAYLGPQYSNEEIEKALRQKNLNFKKLSDDEVTAFTAKELQNQKTIGWFQGRLEFGPRALGNRSILADARSTQMQKTLNLKIKFRESFRPFAPILLEEDISTWFDFEGTSSYMLFLAQIKSSQRLEMSQEQEDLFGLEKLKVVRSQIPGVTHIDYTSRIQSICKETNGKMYDLLKQFKKNTGSSVLINTSFNVRGEPIVCSPTDAIRCFLGTDLDILIIENYVVIKTEQSTTLQSVQQDYKNDFALD